VKIIVATRHGRPESRPYKVVQRKNKKRGWKIDQLVVRDMAGGNQMFCRRQIVAVGSGHQDANGPKGERPREERPRLEYIFGEVQNSVLPGE